MPILAEQNAEVKTIRLDGPVDIAAAAELKAALLDALGSGCELCLSLADVTCLDVTVVQLLWAAERAARARSVPFKIDGKLPEEVAAKLAGVGFEGFPVA